MKLQTLINLAIHKRLNQLLNIEPTNEINSFKTKKHGQRGTKNFKPI